MGDAPPRFSGRAAAPPPPDEAGGAAAAGALVPAAAPPRPPVRRVVGQQIPRDVLEDPGLAAAIALLPANYAFELPKTVWRLRQARARRVALQFPEGLLMYALVIADILEAFAGVEEAIVMGDVTFGACCVDDFSAAAAGADFLVHYGHSCLVPVDVTGLPCLYVFVDVRADVEHLVGCVRATFAPGAPLALAGTVQFAASVQAARAALAGDFPRLAVPQALPLSPGEVLGCTAPALPAGAVDAIVFVADGRFHLEALMIANPTVPAYRYDPYGRVLTLETYDQEGMRAARRAAVEAAAGAERWGLVLGTLGRQGSPRVLAELEALLAARGRSWFVVLLSEVSPAKLAALGAGGGVDAWVQVACPRLSIDWGAEFDRPTLNPYEAHVALGALPGWWAEGGGDYAVDYYAADGGPHAGTYHRRKERAAGGREGGAAAVAKAARARAAARAVAGGAGGGGGAAPG
jgi:2-(3-amino-3-carboxypropyl)histidine synthase